MPLFRRSPRKEGSAPSSPVAPEAVKPAEYDEQLSVPGPILDLINAMAVGDPLAIIALLSNDFMAATSEHQSTRPLNRMEYGKMAFLMPKLATNIRILATATCDLDSTSPQHEMHGKPSTFVLVEGEELAAPGNYVHALFRVIHNLDGQCRFLERFRPLMGPEADQLLLDPDAYRRRMMHDVPRLAPRIVRGDSAHMLGVAQTLCRTIFNIDAYAGDAFDLVSDNVVFFDGHGDDLPGGGGGLPTCIMRGKEALKTFALESSLGMQVIMAAAAAEDTNTAFVQLAMLTMTNSSRAWKNTSWRGILCFLFDAACKRVETICIMRTYRPYERAALYKPDVTLTPPSPGPSS